MRSRTFLFAAALCLALAAPAAARAQADTIPPPGAKVRVAEPGRDLLTGHFWYVRADTMYLINPGEREEAWFIPLAEVQRVEYSRGRRRELWSSMGALLGGTAGVLAAAFAGHEEQDAAAQGNAVLGGAVGVLTGGVAGWLLAPERWVHVRIPVGPAPPPPPVTASAPPAPR